MATPETINPVVDRYGVMGNPIAHSKSPQIHRLFARQTGQAISYEALLAPLDGFADAVARFHADGGKGLNITVPFKEHAWQLVNALTPRAEFAGAVNTIKFEDDGLWCGDNTDGVGLVRDLRANHGVVLAGRRILLLGAGGAVRGVLQALFEHQPAAVVVANRTVDKALELAKIFSRLSSIEGIGFDGLPGRQFDVIVNGTAASLQGAELPLPDDILAAGACCYDMMYSAEPTVFQRWARQHGAQLALDGLGMLVEQAAESFLLWRGVRPDTTPVIEAVRRDMAGG